MYGAGRDRYCSGFFDIANLTNSVDSIGSVDFVDSIRPIRRVHATDASGVNHCSGDFGADGG